MSFHKLITKVVGVLAITIFGFTAIAFAQQSNEEPTPSTLVADRFVRDLQVATGSNLYCAGYIQRAEVDTGFEIVGADDEKEQFIYSQNDYVYISTKTRNVNVGDTFSVIRPRGRVESRWTKKNIGYYVQEVGMVEIIKVKNEIAVGRVKTSCDNLLLGDLLEPVEQRVVPNYADRPALDIFGNPSGKVSGRIVLARDGHEMVTREQIVYIDLGADENVKVGDFLTIYRTLGTGGLRDKDYPSESVSARDEGFQSEEYRGGKFSNQAPRKSGSTARGSVVTTKDAKKGRAKGLRKVVGEMMIVNVKERTATAVIVRTAGEIHTGDRVELQ